MKNFLFFLFLLSASVGATEYFVAPNGDNLNSGTFQAPFKTVNFAVDLLKPGDILTIRGGCYNEQVKIPRNISGTRQQPITIRGAAGEFAWFNAAKKFPTAWKKTSGRRFIWENDTKYAINSLWEQRLGSSYLKVDNMELLDRQPGAFLFDGKQGKVYVHCLHGSDPNTVAMRQVPYYVGSAQAGYSGGYTGSHPAHYTANTALTYVWNKGFIVQGDYINLENLYISYYNGQGIRVNSPATGCNIRNNKIYGGTCGIMFYGGRGGVSNSTITGNYVRHVAGTGLEFSGQGKNCLMQGNVVYNCGMCFPFTGGDCGSSGNIYHIAHYGSYADSDFKDNLVIGDDPTRRAMRNLMRCKGGIRHHTHQSGNVFIGGGVNLYAASQSTAKVNNNTIWGGKYTWGKLVTEEPYEPELLDNLFIPARQKLDQQGFADPSHYDFRLLPGSKHLGKGAFPEAANIVFVAPQGTGDGLSPMNPAGLSSLKRLKKNTTVYFLPGIYRYISLRLPAHTRLANYGKKDVCLKAANIVAANDLQIDGLIFVRSQLRLKTARLKNCVWQNSALRGIQVELDAATLLKGKFQADNLSIANSLFYGDTLPQVQAKKVISANNFFSQQHMLTQWEKTYPSQVPSSFEPVKLDRKLRLPATSALAFSAIDGTAIGGRPQPYPYPQCRIENFRAAKIQDQLVVVAWETPYNYCNNSLWLYEAKNRQVAGRASLNRGTYMETVYNCNFKNLKPGTEYLLKLYSYLPDGTLADQKQLKFRTLQVMPQRHPVTRYVNLQKGPYKSVTAALEQAFPGDTIVLAPGRYAEKPKVIVSDITIKAEIPRTAQFDAVYIFDYALNLDHVKNVTLDGLSFVGNRYSASSKALVLNNTQNVTVKNCYFERYRKPGRRCGNIHLMGYNLDGLVVEDCVFDSGFHGIWIYPGKNITVRNCTFWGQGINAIHVGCEQGDRVEFYNNIYADCVSNHISPAVSVAEHGPHVVNDYNIYWHTDLAPRQKFYSFGRHRKGHPYSAPWSVLKKNLTDTLAETQSRYGVDRHSRFIDPQLVNPRHLDFALQPNSPARKGGRNGEIIGARWKNFNLK